MAPNANRSSTGNKSLETLRQENAGTKRKANQPASPDGGESNERRSRSGRNSIKNRSGSVSNQAGKNENRGDRKKRSQPGAPASSNSSNKRSKRNDGRGGGNKKGPNAI